MLMVLRNSSPALTGLAHAPWLLQTVCFQPRNPTLESCERHRPGKVYLRVVELLELRLHRACTRGQCV
jgi:hypothetical protein